MRGLLRVGYACAAVVALGMASPGSAQQILDPVELSLDEDPLFSVDSPIGPIEYRLGRGMHFGQTGLNVGGFTTIEFEREKGGPSELGFDSINLLVLLQPFEFARAFAEIEIGNFFTWDISNGEVHSDAEVVVERLFGDLTLNDAFTARLGKFQTPIGRWNLVPAEPFTWTALEPVVVEVAFDEHTTGGALQGSFYPGGGTLDYWLYGQFFDPLDPSESPEPADRSAGGRLEYDGLLGDWSVGASFLATERNGDWSYLGGLDGEWQIGPLLLTSEATIQRGDIEGRSLWDVYLQGVWEILPEHLPGLYLTGRYEHFHPTGTDEDDDVNLGDVGITWIPKPYLRLKASYRFADQETDDVVKGVKVNFSFVF